MIEERRPGMESSSPCVLSEKRCMSNQAFVKLLLSAVTRRDEPVGKMNFVVGSRIGSVVFEFSGMWL